MGCGRKKRDSSVDHTATAKGGTKIYVAKSFRLSVIDWLHVARLYIPYILTVAVAVAISCLLPTKTEETLLSVAKFITTTAAGGFTSGSGSTNNSQQQQGGGVEGMITSFSEVTQVIGEDIWPIFEEFRRRWYAYAILAFAIYYGISAKRSVYLVDFAVFEPHASWRVTRAQIIDILEKHGCYEPGSLEFMAKLLANSGTGDATHWPPGTVSMIRNGVAPAVYTTNKNNAAATTTAESANKVTSMSSATSSSASTITASNKEATVQATPARSSRHSSKTAGATPSSEASESTTSSSFTAPIPATPARTHGPAIPVDAQGLATQPDRSLAAARDVAETVLCSAFADLLARTGIKPKSIDFLIVNCSLFCPTPSLTSIVARTFGLRPTVRTYNLGGMGCSASVISIDLAKQLLQNRGNSTAVVLSTEEITPCMYLGNRRDMLLQNTLFRVGGAAILLSNKVSDGFRAKYKLLHTVRMQEMGEEGQLAVLQCEDEAGIRGISLSRKITAVAGRALKDNLTILGPQILPVREQACVLYSMAKRKFATWLNSCADKFGIQNIPGTADGRFVRPSIYVPDFKRAVNHFCIHAGGRAVIDGIEENLHLERYHTAPSRATLYHFGNTSSSSIWYELRYVEGESDKRWKKGGENNASNNNGNNVTSTSKELLAASLAAEKHSRALNERIERFSRLKEQQQQQDSTSSSSSGAGAMPSSNKKTTTKTTATSTTTTASAAAGTSTTDTTRAQQPQGVVPEGWDPERKWSLPEYRNRHIQPGERVLQIAFGSGFKCNSAVWLRLR